jgi:peptidoglycan/xylan/chitin deacetylase (PgdA/CDA1 family)
MAKFTLRRAVKQALAVASVRSGALELLRTTQLLAGPRIKLFGYHHIVTDIRAAGAITMPPLCLSVDVFKAHLDYLQRTHQVMSLEDAAAVVAGRRPAPCRDVAVITFDDGYESVLRHAAPILAERKLPATMFATIDATDGKPLPHDRIFALVKRARRARVRLLGTPVEDRVSWPLARADQALADGDEVCAADAILLNVEGADLDRIGDALAARLGEPTAAELMPVLGWDGLARLVAHGFTIGAHGMSHGHMPLAPAAALEREVATPRRIFKDRLGLDVTSLAYPAGRYDERVVEAARRAGYSCALTTEDRANRTGGDPMRLGRKVLCDEHSIGWDGQQSPDLVAAQMDGLFGTLGLARVVPGDMGPEVPWV